MQSLRKIIIFIVITTCTLLKSMEEMSPEELSKAYTPFLSQNISNIDNIPALCTELAVHCSEQPEVTIGPNRVRDLPLVSFDETRIMGIATKAAKKLDKKAWDITDITWVKNPVANYIKNGIRLYKHEKKACTIRKLGRVYEKVIAAVQSGWSFPAIQMYRHGMRSMNTSQGAYLFIKDVSLCPDNALYGEDTLIRFLSSKLKMKEKVDCNGPSEYDYWLPEGHPHRGKIRLLIKKEAFEKVQEKLKFNLPSQEELEQKIAEQS
jgi:hypothetical protein